MNQPIQLILTIDAQVRSVLNHVYRDKMVVRYHDCLEFRSKHDAARYQRDYVELTKLTLAKYNLS